MQSHAVPFSIAKSPKIRRLTLAVCLPQGGRDAEPKPVNQHQDGHLEPLVPVHLFDSCKLAAVVLEEFLCKEEDPLMLHQQNYGDV